MIAKGSIWNDFNFNFDFKGWYFIIIEKKVYIFHFYKHKNGSLYIWYNARSKNPRCLFVIIWFWTQTSGVYGTLWDSIWDALAKNQILFYLGSGFSIFTNLELLKILSQVERESSLSRFG